ncbi:hypothetical protein [Nonomuraea sp. NPDC050643]|uniref:hypothetical protein n=1 Tax=Nonomuraea sp. NPDC050643 TaxID=3155660 RepID=UPI0033F590A1
MRRRVPWPVVVCLVVLGGVLAVRAGSGEDPDPAPVVGPAARLPVLPATGAPRLGYAVVYDPGVIGEPAAAHHSWRVGTGSGQEWRAEFDRDLLEARADGGRVTVSSGQELRVRATWRSAFTVAHRADDGEDGTFPVVLGDEAVSVVRLGDGQSLRYRLKRVDLRRPAHRVTSADLALPYDLETVDALRPLGRDSVLLRAERNRTWPDHGHPPGPCDWEEFYSVNLKTGAIRWADYRAAEVGGAEGRHIKRQAYARDFVPRPVAERPVPAPDRERCL